MNDKNIILLSPKNGEKVSLLTDVQQAFIKNNGNKNKNISFDYLNLIKQNGERTLPNPIVLQWATDFIPSQQAHICVRLSDDETLSSFDEYCPNGESLCIYNLLANHTYYWQVRIADGDFSFESDIGCFITEGTPRFINAKGLGNVRDIGAWHTNKGKSIKQGLVYRGCEMEFHYTIHEDGRRVLSEDLKIKTDLDLRIEAQGKITSSAMGGDCTLQLIPAKAYGDFLQNKETCKTIFSLLTDESNYPFYIHCWGGADRTGTVIFLLCAILGVKKEDLFLDYELTSLSVWGERSSESEVFVSLLKGLDEYGTQDDSINIKCENFLLSCGITQEEIDKIREILIA